jgi:ankyrin repeat protein
MSRLIDKQMVRATQTGAVESVRELLDSGASINYLYKDGFTPLMRAAYKGYAELVGVLLSCGADPNRTAADGASALFWASIKGHEAIVELLIAADADVNVARRTDENNRNAGYRPINAALSNGHLGIAERLLRAGASLNSRYLRPDIWEYAERHQAAWLLALLKKRRRRAMPSREAGQRALKTVQGSRVSTR